MAPKRGTTTRALLLKEFPVSLAEETAAIFVGAGVSMGAGYPSWKELLRDIGEELGVSSADVSDLAALAQWHIRRSSGATKIRQVIRKEIGIEHAIPDTLDIIARLPVRHIWTTNYDRLIERAFSALGRPLDPISAAADLALKPRAGAVRLYKMHGTVDRLDDLVISTDDYELFRNRRGAFLPLLQAHLSSLSMLFVGLSFTDPNVRHVLSLIREAFTETPPEHFVIVRPPHRSDYRNANEYKARLTQHELWADDLQRYGLRAVEIASYDEVPHLLKEVERKLADRRVWVSGSWPVGVGGNSRAEFVHQVAYGLGRELGNAGLTLVSGSGLLVGSAAVSGFLSSLQRTGSWDLDRRLIARPFPQPLDGKEPNREQWALLRDELGRLSGIVIFIGGQKVVDGRVVEADGVYAERRIADENGAFLIPVGATGGASKGIAESLLAAPKELGQQVRWPTRKELAALLDETKSSSELVALAAQIVKRVAGV
jgi:Sir2- and TIR-associating SLOG family/SIR2-like domain